MIFRKQVAAGKADLIRSKFVNDYSGNGKPSLKVLNGCTCGLEYEAVIKRYRPNLVIVHEGRENGQK